LYHMSLGKHAESIFSPAPGECDAGPCRSPTNKTAKAEREGGPLGRDYILETRGLTKEFR